MSVVIMAVASILSTANVCEKTAHSVCLYDETALGNEKIDEVEETFRVAVEVVSDKLSVDSEYVFNRISEIDLKVHILDTDFGYCDFDSDNDICCGFRAQLMPGLFIWALGLYNSKSQDIHYVYRECIGDSSLGHEIIHVIEYIIYGDAEPLHEDPALFIYQCGEDKSCINNSAETIIDNALRAQFCVGQLTEKKLYYEK